MLLPPSNHSPRQTTLEGSGGVLTCAKSIRLGIAQSMADIYGMPTPAEYATVSLSKYITTTTGGGNQAIGPRAREARQRSIGYEHQRATRAWCQHPGALARHKSTEAFMEPNPGCTYGTKLRLPDENLCTSSLSPSVRCKQITIVDGQLNRFINCNHLQIIFHTALLLSPEWPDQADLR